ncbi:unnamed protein product [Allacma fusca]|uniref:Reverse transcriptase domain-containing protein n=1 Tax=Allacma fusca TaxID=39272 RepID=A0A8J2LLM2_9HEXA|nr:unnamed protein product [Allacma fusca]
MSVSHLSCKEAKEEMRNFQRKAETQNFRNIPQSEVFDEMINTMRTKASDDKIKKIKNIQRSITIDAALADKSDSNKIKYAKDFFSEKFKKHAQIREDNINYLRELPKISEQQKVHMGRDISSRDVVNAICKLKMNKTPGSDGLNAEFYKHFIKYFQDIFLWLFSKCFEQGKLPASMRTGIVALIYKKGDPANFKNYRPISLSNTDYKVFAIIVKDRLSPVLKDIIGSYQTCNIPRRSMFDNLNFIRDATEEISEGAIVSLDQESAFDNVNRDFLYACLKAFDINDFIINFIKLLYNENNIIVKIGELLTSPISVQRGIKQGDPVASLLFILSSEVLLRRISKKLALIAPAPYLLMPSAYLSAYADDTHIFISSEDQIIVLETELATYFEFSGGGNMVV